MTTAVGVVYDDKVDADWVWCLRALEKHKGIVDLIRVPGGPGNFDVARNKVVAKFLDGTATHLLMIDTDMVFQTLDYLTLRAQEAGHKVYVDTNVKLGHIKPRVLYG